MKILILFVKTQSTLALFFAIIISVFIVAEAISFVNTNNSIKEIIGNESAAISHETLRNIDQFIFFRMLESKEMSQHYLLERILNESNNKFSEIENIEDVIDKHDAEWRNDQDENSELIFKVLNNDAAVFFNQKYNFHQNQWGYPLFAEIFLTNSYGANVASTGITSDYRQNDEGWWQKAKENGFHIEDVSYDESAKIYSIDISWAIYDSDGKFAGVLKSVVNIEEIVLVINDAKESIDYESSELKLFSKDGKVIYSTENSVEFLQEYDKDFDFIKDNTQEYFERDERIITFSTSDGYKNFQGFEWILEISYDTDEILEPVHELGFVDLMSVIIASTLAAILSYFLAKNISNPISKLSQVTKEISEGKFPKKIEIKGNLEVEKLSDDVAKMSETIETSHNNLNSLVNEKTKKLTQSLKELRLVDTQKDEFAAMVSHELKTPLVPIRLYVEMLLKESIMGPLNDKQKKALESVIKNVDSLQKLVDDVLDATKIDLGKLRTLKKDIDVAKLIENVFEALNPYTKEKQITLATKVNASGNLLCDPKRIEQVLSNLVKNSIDFVPEKNGKITISVENGPDSTFLFRVEDNGKGIPEESQKKLFKKFYQIDTTVTRSHGGSGLGLSICEGIIKAHGGKIWYDSSYKEGAAFNFVLPKGEK